MDESKKIWEIEKFLDEEMGFLIIAKREFDDELYEDVVLMIVEHDVMSVSHIQRRFQIGFEQQGSWSNLKKMDMSHLQQELARGEYYWTRRNCYKHPSDKSTINKEKWVRGS